jgi:serine/threonine-protein kinase
MSLKLAEGLRVAERFRLIRELGRGGMGSVWLAEHTGLEVHCAIKFIDRDGRDYEELCTRFEREAKAAAQLRSPNVVQILDYGVWQDVPYIAMEYLEGEDLAQRLDRVWVLAPGETCYLTSQVARALSKAHAAGIVHRDLKPENVFLAHDGDEETVKVLDFGIAKRPSTEIGDTGTKTGSLLGTPFYMSPEQARGVKAVDYRSDLWSLAVIVYQCLTGQLPFESEGLGDVLAKIMYEPLPIPTRVKPDLPVTVDSWWQRAAAREPDHRFQTAKELADELAIALGVTQRIQVAALPPRLEKVSWTNLSPYGDGDAGKVAFIGGERSSPHAATLDGDTETPFSGTFNLSQSKSRRTKRIAIAVLGAALLAGTGYVTMSSIGNSETASTAEAKPAAQPDPGKREPRVEPVASEEVVDLDRLGDGITAAEPGPAASASDGAGDAAAPPKTDATSGARRTSGKKRVKKEASDRVDFGI